MLNKYAGNPILRSEMVKYPWANLKVYNCAMVFDGDTYHMLFRAIGSKDFISRIGYGHSRDGIHFEIDPEPVLSPQESFESRGCEDPRITKIDDTYFMTYTAFEGRTGRAALTTSRDLKTWGNRQLLFPDWHEGRNNTKAGRRLILPGFDISTWNQNIDSNWSKAAAIFPEKLLGKYCLLFGDENIWSATSNDLTSWTINPTPILQSRRGYFDQGYIEMGPPPFKTDRGWLIFYHGIAKVNQQNIYRVGAALLDLKDPSRILWRSTKPLIEPTEIYETVGMIDVIDGGWDKLKTITQAEILKLAQEKKLPQAVFCSGAVAIKSPAETVYKLYYSGADTVLCLASGTLTDITRE